MILRKPNNINGLPEELGFSAQKKVQGKNHAEARSVDQRIVITSGVVRISSRSCVTRSIKSAMAKTKLAPPLPTISSLLPVGLKRGIFPGWPAGIGIIPHM